MTATYRILTFVTSAGMYAGMRSSFEAGGFTTPETTYQIVDNVHGNVGDPYSMINTCLSEMPEPYLIVCHQDVRLEDGTTSTTLRDVIEEADRSHPGWAVMGPAGLNMRYKQVQSISDPWKAPKWPGPWPVRAEVLDELLLIVKPRTARLSDGLSGFHFYAADLCLSARRQGFDALIVNFPVHHLSNGESGRLSAEYGVSRDALQNELSRHYHFKLLVATTNESVILSRYRFLRRLARYRKVHRFLKSYLSRVVVP